MREMNIATKHNALQHAVEQMLEHGPRELPQITTLRTDPDLEMLTIGTANVRAEIDHDVYGFGYSAQLIDANGQTIGALIADDAGRVHLTGAEAANHLADIQAIANGLGALQVYQTRSDLLTVPLHIAPEVLPDVLAVSERVCSNIERLADVTPAQRSLSVALVDRELPAVAGLIEARAQQLVDLDVRRDAFLAEVRRGMVLMTPYLAEIERMPRLTDAERSNIGQAMLTWCVERAAIHAEHARNWQFAWGAADQSFKLRDDQIRLLTDILAHVHHDGQGIHFKATDSYPDAIYERSFLEQLRSLKGDPRDRLAENAEAMQWQLEAVMETRPRARQTENDPIWSTVAEDILGAEAFQRVRQHGATVNDFASIPLTDIDALANNVLAHEPASVRLRNAAEDLVKLVAETREALAEVQPQNQNRRVLTEAEIKEWDRLTAPVSAKNEGLQAVTPTISPNWIPSPARVPNEVVVRERSAMWPVWPYDPADFYIDGGFELDFDDFEPAQSLTDIDENPFRNEAEQDLYDNLTEERLNEEGQDEY